MEPKLDGLNFLLMDNHSCETLEQKFPEEIHENLHCSKDKAPGFDGFNMGFLQSFGML